jgi:hypothetical protein
MKHTYPLLTLLLVALVAGAPHPFVKPRSVVTAETADVVIPNTNFGRREAAFVEDFGKKAIEVRDALVAGELPSHKRKTDIH